MAFQLTLPTLLGVIIGGVAFVFCIAVAIVVLFLRIKHCRQLAQTNAASERRLSRYPGGHLSITDEDVAQIPGTGAAMREFFSNQYTRPLAYAAISSRESFEKQSNKKKISSARGLDSDTSPNKALTAEIKPVAMSTIRPWPLPRRLTRANRPSAIEIYQPPPSSDVNSKKFPENLLTEQTGAKRMKMMPRDEFPKARSLQPLHKHHRLLEADPDTAAFPNTTLKPKPLFHEKPRSISHGMIPVLNRNRRFESFSISPGPVLPRSISLTSQDPGMIPAEPIPPLPAEALVIRRQMSKEASGSRRSFLTHSPMQEIWKTPGKPPRKSTDYPEKDLSINDKRMGQPLSSPTVACTGALKTLHDSRKSLQASVQEGITRSNSSGLSESLLNHGWSGSASNASMVKEASQARSKVSAGCNVGPHISVFDFGLPLRSDIDINALSQLDLGDPQAKRRSTSILRTISGNEQSPVPGLEGERPVSIATVIPIRWSTDVLANEMGNNGENKNVPGKDRPRSKRTSVKQHYPSSSKSPRNSITIQKSKFSRITPQFEAQSLRRPRVDPPVIRPPSKLTFDPQLTQTPQSKASPVRSTPNSNPYFNNTFDILTGYADSDNSSSTPPSTPTRKPSPKRVPSGTHPNRQRAIFEGPSKIAQWPLTSQHPALSLSLRAANDKSPEKANNIFRLGAQLNFTDDMRNKADESKDEDGNEAATTSYRPPSLLYRFPSPPSPPPRSGGGSCGSIFETPNQPHSRSQPNIQLNRPAVLDRPSQNIAHSITSSPTLTSNHDHNHSYNTCRGNAEVSSSSASDQLRQSVLAPRRMNSEISEPSRAGREHRRYLSLGGREEAIFEDWDAVGGSGLGEGRQKWRAKGRGWGGVGNVMSGSASGDGAAVTTAAGGSDTTSVFGAGEMEDASGTRPGLNDAPPLLSLSSRGIGKANEGDKEKERSGRGVVRGPRAMPGWLDESMMLSSTSAPFYTPTVAGAGSGTGSGVGGEGKVRVSPGGVVGTDGSWYDGDGFLKLF